MRALPVLLSRIRNALDITPEEMVVVERWIEKRQKENARFERWMVRIFTAIILIAIAVWVLK